MSRKRIAALVLLLVALPLGVAGYIEATRANGTELSEGVAETNLHRYRMNHQVGSGAVVFTKSFPQYQFAHMVEEPQQEGGENGSAGTAAPEEELASLNTNAQGSNAAPHTPTPSGNGGGASGPSGDNLRLASAYWNGFGGGSSMRRSDANDGDDNNSGSNGDDSPPPPAPNDGSNEPGAPGTHEPNDGTPPDNTQPNDQQPGGDPQPPQGPPTGTEPGPGDEGPGGNEPPDEPYVPDPSEPTDPQTPPVSVPEPGMFALMGVGLAALGLGRRRRR